MKMSTKDLTLVTMFAALYAALVYVFAPISFMALQFRVAGIIRPAISKKWILAIGYAIGVVVGNIFSPFAGPWDLLFMPMMSLLAGLLGYIVSKKFGNNYFICGIIVATVIPISVAFMLLQFCSPFLATFPYLLISEQIVCLIGSVVFKLIETRYKWWETK
ncbi:MAG: QueT transporter family protein [Candidatus Bathyarchaeota archaeon]|nr:MAG: QueT transporter family protein [Candidatus Bathyarchaeota archaeon]